MIKPSKIYEQLEQFTQEVVYQIELLLGDKEKFEIVIDDDSPILLSFAWADVRLVRVFLAEDEETEHLSVQIETEDDCGTYISNLVDVNINTIIEIYERLYEEYK